MIEPLAAEPTLTTAARLACRDLSVGYGERTVLRSISLDVHPGAWTSIVGPNGCGKSTLLKALAGLAPARGGQVLLDGRRLGSWPRRERAQRLAWLAQTPPASDLTAREVVALGRFAHSGWLAHHDEQDEAVIERALEATGAGDWAGRRLATLSGGERQRVHIARVLDVEAPLLLLDEPTTHLDPPHQEEVARLLRRQTRQGGVSVVSAIHDLSLALMADRLIVLGRHGLVGHGTVEQALASDWLSMAFETRLDVVSHEGVHLWRPTLGPTREALDDASRQVDDAN